MVISAGTDIVSVARIAALVDRGGARFLRRCFTPLEITYCMAKAEPSRHLAARLAAKEAVVKALPQWDGPLPWRHIEVVNGAPGAPFVRLDGAIAEAAARAGIGAGDIRVSLSHCDSYATAVALVVNRRCLMPHPIRPGVDRLLRDDAAVRLPDPDAGLEALHRAILLEDAFGITLSDDELDPATLGTPGAAGEIVSRHLDGR